MSDPYTTFSTEESWTRKDMEQDRDNTNTQQEEKATKTKILKSINFVIKRLHQQ